MDDMLTWLRERLREVGQRTELHCNRPDGVPLQRFLKLAKGLSSEVDHGLDPTKGKEKARNKRGGLRTRRWTTGLIRRRASVYGGPTGRETVVVVVAIR